MDFDKTKVYTALNADELKVGSKVVTADDLRTLKELVEKAKSENDEEYVDRLERVKDEYFEFRFTTCRDDYNLAYLISELKSRPFKNIDELIDYFCKAEKEDIGSHILYSNYVRPYIWIQNRFTEEVELIATYDYANSLHDDDRVETSTRVLTMDDLYREYKFLNGDICGVKE